MARIRSVKPSLFSSYNLAKLPIEARFLFIGLFCEADDDGQMVDSPKKIVGSIFPHDEKVTEAKVNRWLNLLEGVGCILRYEEDKCRYIAIPEWLTHQRVSHPTPSTFPPPSCEQIEKFMSRTGKYLEPVGKHSALNGRGIELEKEEEGNARRDGFNNFQLLAPGDNS